jgi:hypothetical protein
MLVGMRFSIPMQSRPGAQMPQMWAYAAWGKLVLFAEIQKIKFVWTRCYCRVTQHGVKGDE